MDGLNRRGVLACAGGLGLATLLLPQGPTLAEPLNGQNVKTWRDQSLAHHQSLTADAYAKGYRTLSLSISGTPADPRYVAVMFKLSPLIDTHQFDLLTGAQLDAKMSSEKALGYYPFIISATGSGANAVYAAVFSKVQTLGARAMTKAQFDQGNTAAEAGKVILLWAEAYDDGAGGVLYTACATGNVFGEAWNCEASDEGLPDLQNRFDATYAGWGRAAHVAPTPSGGHLMMFTDSVIGPNSAWGKMNLAQYDAKAAEQVAGGLQPIRICATGAGAATRYAAIYAGRNDIDLKSFQRHSKAAANALIDGLMKNYLAATGIKGCSLAITLGQRLIYASGYTQAEAGYPAVTAATPIRLASVSKVLTAGVIWKLIQEKPDKIALGTSVQSILKLKAPVAGFEAITVQHLLEGMSGLDQSLVMNSVAASAAAGGQLPCTRQQMADYAASFAMANPAGQAWSYPNLDYVLLGMVAAKVQGVDTVEQVLTALVASPLEMGGTHGSRSLLADQVKGDARHHLRVYDLNQALPLKPLDTAHSVRTPDQPIVPTQYGGYDYEVFSGSGGFTASALDLARLMASLSVQVGNPVYTGDTLTTWLNAAADATAAQTALNSNAHGFHGFDVCTAVDPENLVWKAGKGGWLVGHESSINFTTGGFGVVLLNNGNADTKANFDWYNPLLFLLGQPALWDGVDLFQTFGLDPFAAAKSKKLGKPLPPAASKLAPKIVAKPRPKLLRPPMLDPNAMVARQRLTFMAAAARAARRRPGGRAAPIRR